MVVVRGRETENQIAFLNIALEAPGHALFQRHGHRKGLRLESCFWERGEDLPDQPFHFGRREVPDDGQGAIIGHEEPAVEVEEIAGRGRGDDLPPPIDGPAVGMSGEQSLEDEVGRVPLGVVLHLAVLFQDDVLLLVELGLAQVEPEEDLLLVPESELGVLGRQRDLEHGEVLPGVGVEVGSVPADFGADLRPGTVGRPAEQDAVLEQVNESVGFIGLVLGSDVEAGDDMEERQIVLFEEEDAEAVVEDEVPAWIRGAQEDGKSGQIDSGQKAGPAAGGAPSIPAHGQALKQLPCQSIIRHQGLPSRKISLPSGGQGGGLFCRERRECARIDRRGRQDDET
jgi:hypothetical protein